MIQLYIIHIFFFRFFSHISYPRILSRLLCALQQVLVDDLSFISSVCIYVHPKLLVYPSHHVSPLVTINLFSISVSLFLFCK